MKNVCKKLFSLMLVAVMLVSIVPFSAMAASNTITVGVKQADGTILMEGVEKEIKDLPTTVQKLWDHKVDAAAKANGAPTNYYMKSLNDNTLTDMNATVEAGDKVVFVVPNAPAPTPTPTPTPTPEPETKHYVTVGVKVNGEFTMPETKVEINGASATAADLLKYKAENVSGDFVKYWTKSGGDSTDMNASINENDRIIFVFETKKEEADPIKVVVKVNNSDNVVFQGYKVPANGEYALAENLLTYAWNKDWDDVYTVDHAWSHDQQKKVGDSAKIYAGDTISFMLNPKNGTNNGGSNSGSNGGTNTGNGKDLHEAYLEIYLRNGSSGAPVYSMTLRIDRKDEIGYDGRLSMAENGDVRQLVRKYYSAKDADGISYDGLYIEKGSTIANWLYDLNKYDEINDLTERRQDGKVYVAVVLSNATKKTSGTADSSNPKTGDDIFVAVTFMAVSATALTALYFYNKKRMVK